MNEEESNKKNIEENIYIKFPWKRIIVGGTFVVVFTILMRIINTLSGDYFTPLRISISIVVLLLLISGTWFFIKKRKESNDPKNLSEKKDTPTEDINELHKEEEELKKKLHEIRSKSFEIARKSKDEEVREHHDKFKGEVEKPINSKRDIRRVLKAVDGLLGKLPEKEISKFSKTKEAKAYKEILKKYGVE